MLARRHVRPSIGIEIIGDLRFAWLRPSSLYNREF
jgi:hypothetical protein